MTTARYLATYDWPVTASSQIILTCLKKIAAQLGNTVLPVLVLPHGKKKSVSIDLFRIDDLSALQSIERADASEPAGALGDLFYSYDKNLDMAALCIAVDTSQVAVGAVQQIIHFLNEARCLGYSIAFDSPLGKKGLYYALGITYGQPKTHYEEMCADNLGRFFFQRTRKNRSDRAYSLDKIRNIYPVNVLNSQQKQSLQSETDLEESRFAILGEGKYLLALDDGEVFSLRDKLVGSVLLI